MISDFLLEQIASETKEKIARAEIVIDGKTEEVQILRKDQEKNLLKVFVNTTKSCLLYTSDAADDLLTV